MNIFNLFKSNDDDARKSYLKELIRVAKADGHLEEREHDFILKVGKRLACSPEVIEELSAEVQQDDRDEVRQSRRHRLRLVLDLVVIMMIDESIDPKELVLCKSIAMKSGFEPEVIDDVVHRIKQDVRDGGTIEKASEKVLQLYSQA